MSTQSEIAEKREAEKKALEDFMAQCRKTLATMEGGTPEDAERIKGRLDDVMKGYTKLPMDFKRTILTGARAHECNANMRATDVKLKNAAHRALADDKPGRNELIAEARKLSGKAITLGAGDEFRLAVKHKIENIMMTGGVEHKGPTVAKPLSTAPVNPNRAKA
jgi:hypothetical protein